MSTLPKSERVTIGKILGAHGIRGALKVMPLTDFPDRFFDMESIVLEGRGHQQETLTVDHITTNDSKGTLIIQTRQITSRDDAEMRRGRSITVAQEDRVELGEDEYWIDSLIGLDVISAETSERIGIVEEVMITGGNDVYLIRAADGSLKAIPAIAEVITKIDIEARQMTVVLLDGLWD